MIHGYWVVLFAEELGWQMLPTIWTGFRPTDRFFMKDCGHVSLLINELEFPRTLTLQHAFIVGSSVRSPVSIASSFEKTCNGIATRLKD